MSEKWEVMMTVYVTVTVNDREPLDRVDDEWRSRFYSLDYDEDVVEHFAYNAVINGVHDITRLDGWADCDPKAILVEVEGVDMSANVLPEIS